MSPDEQRIAAVDEFLARTMIHFVRLGELASCASFTHLAHACAPGLADVTGSLLSVLDSALAAHGRDTGYSIDVWRADIALGSERACGMLRNERLGPDEYPLPLTIDRAARSIAEAIPALTRDRIAVPAAITSAAAEVLVVYAAACDDPPAERKPG